MKILSLFDGISCGMVALERAGIQVDKYTAFEIEPNAIKISEKNYPQIEHCGDVTVADFTKYAGVDLLIGGSPCQDISQMNTYGEGLKGKRSGLFFEYVRALKEAKPKYFLLENVCGKKDAINTITSILGVEPIKINSALVSAQKRNRLYWTNIPNVTMPADKGIKLKDILLPWEEAFEGYMKENHIRWLDSESGQKAVKKRFAAINGDKSICITHRSIPSWHTQYISEGRQYRMLTPIEVERLQTLPDDYTNVEGIDNTKRYMAIGNGWTVDVIAHIFKGLPK